MNTELKKKLIKDLEKSGLGSEMRVLNIFHALGWSARSGEGYFDKDENKTREIDISAHSSSILKSNDKICVYNSFHISAEVKKSKRPWIVFRYHPRRRPRACAWNNMIHAINMPLRGIKLVKALSEKSLYVSKGWYGSGVHEAFKKPDMPSAWYTAFTAVCKACEDDYVRNESEGNERTDNILENPTEFNFFQPVVILDGILVTADLTEKGDIKIEEIDSAPFAFEFRTKNYSRHHYRIDLVTISGLKKYLKLVMQRQQDINSAIKSHAAYAFK
jgi:hypothetical protein